MALLGDFDFAVRYTKGEEKVCVLDRNPWLAKMKCGWIIAVELKPFLRCKGVSIMLVFTLTRNRH